MSASTIEEANCPICGGEMEVLLGLPKLPLTELYEPWAEDFEAGRATEDQAFLFCQPCGHGKLRNILPPAMLYGPGYRTKTAASGGALQAVHRFADFIKRSVGDFDTVLDIGGNDASLVRQFHGKRQIIVDPHATEGEDIRSFIEDADISHLKAERKLIVSSHTIEHLYRPEVMLDKIASVMLPSDTVALQFPSLELLIEDARIDQIHHQHVHYFTLRSIGLLLAKHGLEIIRHQFDHAHYGALMVLCRIGSGWAESKPIASDAMSYSHARFARSLESCADSFAYRSIIGFGAGLMLPILAYHLPELEDCEYIADNDRLKHGLRYVNFNVPIRADYDLAGRDVVITAIATKQAARLLVCQAFEKGARNVFVPLHGL